MDNKNKFTASLNAYMAKHKLNTNATSAAMGVSVPTLRKALRGQSVSRKTAAKIESIIKSGKVPAEAHKTATKAPAKKTALKKPAASKQVKPAATAKQPAAKAKQTKSAEQVSASKPATTPKASRVQTKRAANQQSQATSQTPTAPQTEAAASSKPARRTAKRVTRSTVTSRQNQRPNNQQEHNNNEQTPKQTPVQKKFRRGSIASRFASSRMLRHRKQKLRLRNVRLKLIAHLYRLAHLQVSNRLSSVTTIRQSVTSRSGQ
ncbi:hemagglutinin protein [Lacticaseibacillus paracasei]|nr:hemagglutinin protein [Lacticaseibacillus paracasei]